ncbi:hypothetical protein [Bradyrhizobium sp. Bra64]|uniref:hypothetical protein n=1 Tax=Bradyrhizobium sp. Bra64 TaxID=2926009 RepID=UPI002119757E|nr:hypothetical protein [Bradyrhizobium sp. Bra64]
MVVESCCLGKYDSPGGPVDGAFRHCERREEIQNPSTAAAWIAWSQDSSQRRVAAVSTLITINAASHSRFFVRSFSSSAVIGRPVFHVKQHGTRSVSRKTQTMEQALVLH